MKTTIVLLLSAAALLSACSKKVNVNAPLMNRILEANLNPCKLQYFNSQTFYLEREVKSEDIKLAMGKVKYINGHFIEKIKIKKNTAAICDSLSATAIFVRFEQGDGRQIPFSISESASYMLDKKKEVIYDHKTWRVRLEFDQDVYLRLANDKEKLFKTESRIAKGVLVN